MASVPNHMLADTLQSRKLACKSTSRNATLSAGAMMLKPFMKQLAWWQHGFQPIGGQGLATGNAYMSHTVPHTRRLRAGAKRMRRSGAQQALMGRGNDDPNVADDEGAPILCPVCTKGGYMCQAQATDTGKWRST